MLSIIVAIDENYGIGRKGDLLCHLPNDLKHFKEITSGHPVIMGRKTYMSLPRRPLPNRRNIVISQHANFASEGAEMVKSIDEALQLVDPTSETFIIGGGSIYEQLMEKADRLYITRIHHSWDDADTFFPRIEANTWHRVSCEKHESDEKHAYSYSFEEWERL